MGVKERIRLELLAENNAMGIYRWPTVINMRVDNATQYHDQSIFPFETLNGKTA